MRYPRKRCVACGQWFVPKRRDQITCHSPKDKKWLDARHRKMCKRRQLRGSYAACINRDVKVTINNVTGYRTKLW